MIDTEPIIRLASELAERVLEQAQDSETGFDGFPRQIIICAEIDCGDRTRFQWASSDDRPWVQVAFLEHSVDQLLARQDQLRFVQDDD